MLWRFHFDDDTRLDNFGKKIPSINYSYVKCFYVVKHSYAVILLNECFTVYTCAHYSQGYSVNINFVYSTVLFPVSLVSIFLVDGPFYDLNVSTYNLIDTELFMSATSGYTEPRLSGREASGQYRAHNIFRGKLWCTMLRYLESGKWNNVISIYDAVSTTVHTWHQGLFVRRIQRRSQGSVYGDVHRMWCTNILTY